MKQYYLEKIPQRYFVSNLDGPVVARLISSDGLTKDVNVNLKRFPKFFETVQIKGENKNFHNFLVEEGAYAKPSSQMYYQKSYKINLHSWAKVVSVASEQLFMTPEEKIELLESYAKKYPFASYEKGFDYNSGADRYYFKAYAIEYNEILPNNGKVVFVREPSVVEFIKQQYKYSIWLVTEWLTPVTEWYRNLQTQRGY